jgi:hypothetical protein
MNTDPISSSPASAQYRLATAQQPSAATVQRFSKMMSSPQEDPATQTAATAADDAAMWNAVYDKFTDSILRSGIRRTIDNINELKRIYREEM